MVVHFYIRYKTYYGQSLSIRLHENEFTGNNIFSEIKLQYLNEEYWYGTYEPTAHQQKNAIFYHYVLLENDGRLQLDHWPNRYIRLQGVSQSEIAVYDDWQDISFDTEVFKTRPFSKVFDLEQANAKPAACKRPSHVIQVHAPYLPAGKVVCMVGSAQKLKNWDEQKPLLLHRQHGSWFVNLDLEKESFPIAFKFGVYDVKQKKIVSYEEGENRVLNLTNESDRLNCLHLFARLKHQAWKAAGVNVQLSSLKSEKSWGVGDFSDLNLLTNWSTQVGIKLIQLLPINDTTATLTRKDSYPYSAISAFALHPIFLDVQKIAKQIGFALPPSMVKSVKQINQLPTLDYEEVIRIKNQAIQLLFQQEQQTFEQAPGYTDFFETNKDWLEPYAAFCYLRMQFNTADFSQWKKYAIYDADKVAVLTNPSSTEYPKIAIHYYTQFQLHCQLKEAVDHAHQKGVVIKGDLPIGVGRHSVDTWMHPTLFHMDMQAGAPPDAFAVKGQNWSFPTYNWEAMRADGYAWWRQRMENMSHYFDAIRIDHILGFFRIWSIPLHAIEGILGVFKPTFPLSADDFIHAGYSFDEAYLCNPLITDEILHRTFGEKTLWVKENILSVNRFKDAFNTQRKIDAYCKNHQMEDSLRQGLIDLISNVMVLRDDKNPSLYHFRISMQDTAAYRQLPTREQGILNEMYRKYFYEKQNELWYTEAQKKLDAIQKSSDMLICAEDLGMVPDMVEGVLKSREILALQVQRMPKTSEAQFSHPANAPYLTVVTPSTHDMSTLREWWEENRSMTHSFFNHLLQHTGEPPYYGESWICKEIVSQHMQSPAMLSVFLLQDLMAMEETTRRLIPSEERINNPADPDHYWNYRVHLSLEKLIKQKELNQTIHQMVAFSGRL